VNAFLGINLTNSLFFVLFVAIPSAEFRIILQPF